jgi:DNA (cytosine-5)-methyltransferase 1
MKYLSLCSGIEAATVAWHPLGWEAVAYSEIERFPSEVLAHHYPNTPNLGDMTKFKEWTNVSNVDVLVGGTPCQSFSVAGLRKGLDDPRGNLMLTYLAIAKRYRPNWLVWENVPGVLSSNGGRDFGSFLGGLAECGYGFAYRVLDAQFFGVAQRRRRVFVVGYLGDWRPAAAVLFERHSLQGHPAPSREKRQGVAASTGAGAANSSAITARMVAFGEYSDDGTASAMKARDYKDATDLVAQPVVVDRAAFNQGKNAQYKFRAEHSETMDSLVARGPHAVLQPIPIHDQATRHAGKNGEKTMGKGNGLGVGHPGEPMNTLTKGDRHAVAQPIAYAFDSLSSNSMKSANPASGCNEVDVSKALDTSRGLDPSCNQGGIGVAQPIAFSRNDDGGDATHDLSPTMRVAGNAGGMLAAAVGTDIYNGAITGDVAVPLTNRADGTGTGPTVMQPICLMDQGGSVMNIEHDMTGTLRRETHGHEPLVMQSMAVRRLTPVECERLQGFPDSYTDIKSKNKPTPDGPRYKALGNSMAVPVMAWIGARIQQYEDLNEQR